MRSTLLTLVAMAVCATGLVGCMAFQNQSSVRLTKELSPSGGTVSLCRDVVERPFHRETSLTITWDDDPGRCYQSTIPNDVPSDAIKFKVDAPQRRAWVVYDGQVLFSVDDGTQTMWKYGTAQPAWAVVE